MPVQRRVSRSGMVSPRLVWPLPDQCPPGFPPTDRWSIIELTSTAHSGDFGWVFRWFSAAPAVDLASSRVEAIERRPKPFSFEDAICLAKSETFERNVNTLPEDARAAQRKEAKKAIIKDNDAYSANRRCFGEVVEFRRRDSRFGFIQPSSALPRHPLVRKNLRNS